MLLPNETILKAISWTLLHSLWQGLILAIFAGLVILFTKKTKANLRYSILSGLFLAFMIAVGFTFNYEYQRDEFLIASEEIILVNDDINQDEIVLPTSKASDYFQMGIDFLNKNSKAIVIIWFLIFSIKCFGIFRSLSNIYRIRNYRNQSPPEYWSQRVLELSQILKIKKHIVLLESQLVTVPSVTGFFKPIILIPIGLLSNLPQDQIEAILLHELAHIQRKDYFINLIQSFAEILFFFNPGVLWVSSIIKEERENCCDDIAVEITKSKSKFINALVSFQEYNMKQNQLAMGFGSKKNQLLERAKRIIHDNNKSLNSIEKTFLSICIIVIASFTVACSNSKAATSQLREEVAFAEEVAEGREATSEELSSYEQAMMEAEVAQSEAQAEIDIEAAEAAAEAEVAQVEAEEALRESERAIAETEKALSEANLSDEELQEIKAEAAQARREGEIARVEAKKARFEADIARKEADIARKEAEKGRKEAEIGRREAVLSRSEAEKGRKAGELARIEGEKARLQAMKSKIEADQKRLEAQKALIQSQIDLQTSSKKSKTTSLHIDSKNDKPEKTLYIVGDNNPENPNTISDQIISELLKEKIIKSTENLSFKLSTSKLIVNNKEISLTVQKKLKKYLPKGITATYYNYDLSKEN